ncbi:hypothetical protein [Calderihabitans maritimus]|uniref:Uncharacterized protein n=1 Tax=Calderihabitans maritimus TaxID=1246530 RepID=A0A1Z5HT92_9FIRM|nr:hypothetical protein [Calderihabitans maritimus]GAW92525.1 hypothetical protein KKC1_16790 [Calderihabitans maritimus]
MPVWTLLLAGVTLALYFLLPDLGLRSLRTVLGFSLFLQVFYLTGHYLANWPFPTPLVFLQIIVVVGLGVGLGVLFSRFWPLPPNPGFERIMRTLILAIPALGLGIGLQLILQGNQATQALYLIFALAAWLGSGRIVRET